MLRARAAGRGQREQRLLAGLEVGVGEGDHRLVELGVVGDLADLDRERAATKSRSRLDAAAAGSDGSGVRRQRGRPAAAARRGRAAFVDGQRGRVGVDRPAGARSGDGACTDGAAPARRGVVARAAVVSWPGSVGRVVERRGAGRRVELAKLSPTICCSISSILALTPLSAWRRCCPAAGPRNRRVATSRRARRAVRWSGPRGAPCAACRTRACARSRCAACARSSPSVRTWRTRVSRTSSGARIEIGPVGGRVRDEPHHLAQEAVVCRPHAKFLRE